ncbi:MAG: glycosyltransferase family 2 protein [Bacteroidia bacterium]|nr:glycosyltransferase family 2 protein [Bacteroidia bacterium]
MELSAVLITYNEAHRIRPTLEALQGWVDEIVIVDSGSTDSTREIACAFPGVRWYERTFMGYGPQKNYANRLASGRYILSIDADEVVSPELREAIVAEKGRWSAQAYSLLRVAIYCGAPVRAGDWYPDWKVRLFAREIAHWDEAPVHERLILSDSVRPKRLSGELWHYSYHTVAEHVVRNSYYARLGAEVLYAQGRRVCWMRPFLKGTARFIKSLFLKGGWRLGWRGWAIAFIGAEAYFLREIYLAERYAQGEEIKSLS